MTEDKIDTKWFHDRLKDKGLSLRGLSKLMGNDPSTMSMLLRAHEDGRPMRRMTIDVANELAHHLNVAVGEVMRRAGVEMETKGVGGKVSLPVVGWADQNGKAELNWKESRKKAPVLADLPADAVVLQWRTAQSSSDSFDGWLIATVPPREPRAESMLDRYCLVGLKNGEAYLRSIRRGMDETHFTLVGMHGQAPMHDVEVEWFSPVLMLLPN